MMTMSACSDEEFTCDSGYCISMENKCDGKLDCYDGSDETYEYCNRVIQDIGYNKDLGIQFIIKIQFRLLKSILYKNEIINFKLYEIHSTKR